MSNCVSAHLPHLPVPCHLSLALSIHLFLSLHCACKMGWYRHALFIRASSLPLQSGALSREVQSRTTINQPEFDTQHLGICWLDRTIYLCCDWAFHIHNGIWTIVKPTIYKMVYYLTLYLRKLGNYCSCNIWWLIRWIHAVYWMKIQYCS